MVKFLCVSDHVTFTQIQNIAKFQPIYKFILVIVLGRMYNHWKMFMTVNAQNLDFAHLKWLTVFF